MADFDLLLQRTRRGALSRSILDWAAAAAIAVAPLAGCSDAHSPGSTGGGGSVSTAGGGMLSDAGPGECAVDALRAALEADYVGTFENRGRLWFGHPNLGPDAWNVVSESGERCGGAELAACQDAITEVRSSDPDGPVASGARAVLVNRGTEVVAVSWRDPLLEQVEAIDSPELARLLVWLMGYDADCGDARADGDGFIVPAELWTERCGVDDQWGWVRMRYQLRVDREGNVTPDEGVEVDFQESNDACAVVGRAPGDLCPVDDIGADTVGTRLARIAHLERAAIIEFERIARDLERFGAPAELVSRAREAADDERIHAAEVAALAAQHGVRAPRAETSGEAPRDLLTFAMENATEGCVREAFGVFEAAHQARAAADARTRAVFERIAEDESRHAALSWEIAAWLDARLTPTERAHVAVAFERAKAELFARRVATYDEVGAAIGRPDQRAMDALYEVAAATLFAA